MFGRTGACLRRSAGPALLAALLMTFSVACSDDSSDRVPGPTPTGEQGQGGPGPFFGPCGNISAAEVATISGIGGLTNTVNNSSGCEWTTGDVSGPHLSFNWYRGSPIGRERATEQLSRDSVKDVSVQGKSGFLASSEGICEIGIAFGADFFEWSLSTGATSAQAPLRTTEQLCDSATRLADLTTQRGQS